MTYDDLLIALGHEFKRRHMTRHVQALRAYYRSRERRALSQALEHDRKWDDNLVVEWLAILSVTPFEHVYAKLPPGEPCPRCKGQADADIRAVFPGGRLQRCRACRSSWVVELPTVDAYTRGPR